jgi:hypothetical protein
MYKNWYVCHTTSSQLGSTSSNVFNFLFLLLQIIFAGGYCRRIPSIRWSLSLTATPTNGGSTMPAEDAIKFHRPRRSFRSRTFRTMMQLSTTTTSDRIWKRCTSIRRQTSSCLVVPLLLFLDNSETSTFAGGWRYNAFIYGPTLSSLIAASSSETYANEMIDAAGEILSRPLPASYYPRSWVLLSNLMINGSMESAGNTLRRR